MTQQLTPQRYGQQRFFPLQVSHAENNPPSITGKNNLPAFLNKLYGMVNSVETDLWVHWNDEGTTFIIPNAQSLAEQVLGRHYKHNKFASFVRQLNMYGFHKVPHLNHGVLHDDGLPEIWEFYNEYFRRDDPAAMRHILRKKGEAEKARSAAVKHQTSSSHTQHHNQLVDIDELAIVRAEIQTIAARQHLIRDELSRISQSTEKLWESALETRVRHHQQQAKIESMLALMSEVFMKRPTELPGKVRGLLEGPTFEELSPETSVQTPVSPEAQKELVKMIANGKAPVGWFDNVRQWDSGFAVTPMSTTSPITYDTPDPAAMNLAPQSYTLNDTANSVNPYRVDYVGNEDYADFLTYPTDNQDTTFNLDGWGEFATHIQAQDTLSAGQKRGFEDEEEIGSAKRTRV
jgi:HSF-type DNA-binding